MKDELASIVRPKLIPYQKKLYQPLKAQTKEHMVNIATISALGIHYNLRTNKNKAFSTSLYKINYIL